MQFQGGSFTMPVSALSPRVNRHVTGPGRGSAGLRRPAERIGVTVTGCRTDGTGTTDEETRMRPARCHLIPIPA